MPSRRPTGGVGREINLLTESNPMAAKKGRKKTAKKSAKKATKKRGAKKRA
jgi:hypothetical protein